VAISDWELVQQLAVQALTGDAKAYHSFLNLVSKRLKPRFKRILPESHVDDALQETLMAIHKSLHTLDVTKPIAPWLNAIAHYKIQDQLRALYRSSELEDFSDETLVPQMATYLDGSLNLEALLRQLSDREREIVSLLKVQELSVQEVSKKLGMTPSNVKVVTFRAMQKLRVLIAKEEFYESR
jgi:RNA polymerase sigma factor (sigma-70 family)